MNFRVIASLFLLLFLGLADNQTIAALLPQLVHSFNIRIALVGFLGLAYSLAAALASLISGALSDHYGRRWFLRAGAVLFALASWTASLSQSFVHLVFARFITGLAAGTISTCSIAFAGDWFPYSIRGRAIGLISSAYFVAPILGVPLAAFVAQHYGWRRAFLAFSLLGLVAGLASWALPVEQLNPQPSSEKFLSTMRAFGSFLSRRDTLAGVIIAFLVSGGFYAVIYYIGQWLSAVFNVTTQTIGWVFMFGGLVAVVSAPLGGAISDRWTKRAVSIGSNAALAVSIVCIPFIPWGVGLLAAFGVMSLGAAFRQGPLTALMTELVPPKQRGAFIALRNVFSQLGIGSVVLAGGVLYQRHGYFAVTSLCALMTALVAVLLATHIAEPRPEAERV